MIIKGISVKGIDIDQRTRCSHYHTQNDIVAIKFKCCNTYYPCHLCHEDVSGHSAEQWSIKERDEKAILCGACGTELTIRDYMHCQSQCPVCQANFNPGCERHYHLYFNE